MTYDQANRLLTLSRRVDWKFPSSSGTPIPIGVEADELVRSRADFREAALALKDSRQEESALELVANVWRVWLISPRDIGTGRAFLAAALAGGNAKPSRARALALYGDSLLAFWQGSKDESRKRSEAAVEVADQVGDSEARVLALSGLSRAVFEHAEYERARDIAAEARKLAEHLEPALGQASLHMCAQATRITEDYDRAAALFEESLELNRRLADEGMITVELHNLGHVEARRGNIRAAERYFAECSTRMSADDPYDAALTALNQAVVAFARGDRGRAAALGRLMESILLKSDLTLAADDAYEADRLRQVLGFQK